MNLGNILKTWKPECNSNCKDLRIKLSQYYALVLKDPTLITYKDFDVFNKLNKEFSAIAKYDDSVSPTTKCQVNKKISKILDYIYLELKNRSKDITLEK